MFPLLLDPIHRAARGEQEVQATEALLAYFHANLQ